MTTSKIMFAAIAIALQLFAPTAAEAIGRVGDTVVVPWDGECTSFGASRVGKTYPVMAVASGDVFAVSEWSCAAIDGELQVALRLCAGTLCGPYFGVLYSTGGCGFNVAQTHDIPAVDIDVLGDRYIGPQLLRGPAVLQATVLTKAAGTKGFSVCIR